MRNQTILIPLAGLAVVGACVPKPITDPHVMGVKSQQWVATVPKMPAATFDIAMRVLTDSVYPIADARKDAGLIRTGKRKQSDVQRGAQQVRAALGLDYAVQLSLLILPLGTDSSRLTLTGEYEVANHLTTITARDRIWPVVEGIGHAIVRSAQSP